LSSLIRLGVTDDAPPRQPLPDSMDYGDPNLSWHYHLFAYLSTQPKYAKPGTQILEIGTFEGEFTRFLSRCFPQGHIHTFDLPSDNPIFLESYGRHENLDSHLRERATNLEFTNVTFYARNSSEIPSVLGDASFDLIWVDGDHHDPQVSIDIDNCIQLMNTNSLMLVDDIVMFDLRSKLESIDSFLKLQRLETLGILKNWYFLKRTAVDRTPTKWIAVSELAANAT